MNLQYLSAIVEGFGTRLLTHHHLYKVGPPADSVQLPYFRSFIVDITILTGRYFMVYKPTIDISP